MWGIFHFDLSVSGYSVACFCSASWWTGDHIQNFRGPKTTIHSDALFQHKGNKKSLILRFLLLHMNVPRRDDNHLSFDHESSHWYSGRSCDSDCSHCYGCGYG